MPKAHAVALILTALPVEYEAVRHHLCDLEESEHKGTIFETGRFHTDERDWTVVIAQTGAGNASAAVITERAITAYAPRVALFVGIAGGIKDVRFGDVVAANKIFGYESGKALNSFVPRADAGRTSHRMVQRALTVARQNRWQDRIPRSLESPPVAMVGPIVAGEKVVASRKSEIYRFIRAEYDTAVAVEMEGRGFVEATFANDDLTALVIRGISDLIDRKSAADASGSQVRASEAAAAFAYEMLATITFPDFDSTSRVETSAEALDQNTKAKGSTPQPFRPTRSLPFPRNPNFTGRIETLRDLNDSYKNGGLARGIRISAITGLGGIGKSQLANEYAHRFSDDFELIWWLNASAPDVLISDFAVLGRALGIVSPDTSPSIACEATKSWLSSDSGNWLLVFDNAESPDAISSFLPSSDVGQILITSKNPNWKQIAAEYPLDVFKPDEGTAFLAQRAGRQLSRGSEEYEAAIELHGLLGGLPLALEQAATFIEYSVISIRTYVGLVRDQRDQVDLKALDESVAGEIEDARSVLTTWRISISMVAQTPGALDLLRLFSFFAPSQIPRRMIEDLVSELPAPLADIVGQPIQYLRALGALRRYSLITINEDDMILVHKLVQAVIRLDQSEQEKQLWADTAIRTVNQAFPTDVDNSARWPHCAFMLDHVHSTTDHAEQLDVTPVIRARLYNQLGILFIHWGMYAYAVWPLERALELSESVDDNKQLELAVSYNSLYLLHHALGDFPLARRCIDSAIECFRKNEITDPGFEVVLLSNLGAFLGSQGNLREAKSVHLSALRRAEELGEDQEYRIVRCLSNLAVILDQLEENDEAERLLARALKIARRAEFPNEAEIGSLLNNLGNVHRELNKLDQARQELEESVRIGESTWFTAHPFLPNRLCNLARVCREMGDISTARRHIEKALHVGASILPPTHGDLAAIHFEMSLISEASGDLVLARLYRRKSVQLTELSQGAEHPNYANRLASLGALSVVFGDFQSAVSQLSKAWPKLFSGDDPDPGSSTTWGLIKSLANA